MHKHANYAYMCWLVWVRVKINDAQPYKLCSCFKYVLACVGAPREHTYTNMRMMLSAGMRWQSSGKHGSLISGGLPVLQSLCRACLPSPGACPPSFERSEGSSFPLDALPPKELYRISQHEASKTPQSTTRNELGAQN